VVLENIERRVEHGQPRETAAVEGANEVLLAIVASTLVLASIFAVVVFVPGIPGKLIGSFGVVVACGVLVSLFVSLTLTPMLCARYLKVGREHSGVYRLITGWLDAMEEFYRRAVLWSLAHRGRVVALAVALVLGTFPLFSLLGFEFFPAEDEGQFQISVRTPTGSSLEYGDERMQRIEELTLAHPEIETIFATLGGGRAGSVNQGLIYVSMQPPEKRDISQQQMIALLRTELAQVPGIVAFPAPYGPSGSSRGVELSGPLAVAVIGGMVSSTLLSLVVVPAVYSLVASGRRIAVRPQ
jgi:HAE1 family hydrophobic/amphiphilic exporter-1